jgi:hypothetical protein
VEALALYAGQGAALAAEVCPAAAIVDQLTTGAADALKRVSRRS